MGWSAWQDPWVAEFPGPDNPADSRLVGRQLVNSPGADFDVAAWLDSARATIMAGGGDSISAFVSASLTIFLAVTGDVHTARLALGYAALEWDEADVPDSVRPIGEPPTVPADAGFPPDPEYDDPTYGPYIFGRIGYEGPARGEFVAWGHFGESDVLQTYKQFDDAADLVVVMGDPTPQVTYSWLTSIGVDEWLAYPAGTVLSVDDAPVDGTATAHEFVPAFRTAEALVGLTAPQLWLVAQPSFLDPSVPLPHGIVSAGPAWFTELFNGGIPRSGGAGPFFRPGPQIQAVTSRWRYWIDDSIYTIGGHWSDPNGVVVKRLKDDGVTWIPIVDGLAPPLR